MNLERGPACGRLLPILEVRGFEVKHVGPIPHAVVSSRSSMLSALADLRKLPLPSGHTPWVATAANRGQKPLPNSEIPKKHRIYTSFSRSSRELLLAFL